MSILTWEEIEATQAEINNRMKEVESKLMQEDLEEEDLPTLTEQLFSIQKTIAQFQEIKDEFLKDKI